MKTTYDPRTDTLVIELKPGPVAESDESNPDIIIDYDASGNLVSLEILDASTRIPATRTMAFEVAASTGRSPKAPTP